MMLRKLLALPVSFYRLVISPLKPNCCRFTPSCSEYALDALRIHGALKGGWLALKRIARCHPWTEPRFDPVPTKSADEKQPLS